MAELVVPPTSRLAPRKAAREAAVTPWGWERARSLLVDAVERGQSFLGVGWASGLLMESMAAWAHVEPYGLEISPELAALARRRLPEWADRIWLGNAIDWVPDHRFDIVRTSLDYVPRKRRPALAKHLLAYAGRLVIGVFNEERDRRALERDVTSWGFRTAGCAEREHPDPRIRYRAFWIDAPS
jgi:hypothetical protein